LNKSYEKQICESVRAFGMETINQKISEQLTNAGYANFEFIRLDKSRVESDGNGNPFYEKKRLLIIFKNRLKGGLLYDPGNKIIEFLRSSVAVLESIPDDSEIYYWQIKINGNEVSGRSTENQILHIFPDNPKATLYFKGE
jgi:hypothetical protein